MRVRLITTYAIVMILTIFISFISAAIFLTKSSANYLTNIQATNTKQYLQNLADYYAVNGSWRGVESYIMAPTLSEAEHEYFHFQEVLLASPDGTVVFSINETLLGSKVNKFFLTFASKISVNDKIVGYLISGRFLKKLPSNFSGTLSGLFMNSLARAGIIALLIGFSLAAFMANRLLRPIEATISAARKISEGDFSQRVPPQAHSGIHELITAINEMAVNLEKNDLKRSSLFSDLAHDFRTPLAVQRATIEAIEDGLYPLNHDTLTTLKDQNLHLSRLVEDLGLLARLDAGRFTLITNPTDLAEFTIGVVNRFESLITQQNRRIRILTAQKNLMVEIDNDRIEQILGNILQNAMLYTPKNTPIDVSVFQKGATAVVTVRDHGPGIPADKLETIFDRYYRLNQENGQDPGGQGIGLAIARRLARVHGGNLTVRNHQEGGAQFVLELPLMPRDKRT